MFNKQKVIDLLEERKIKHKELLDYLGKNYNVSLKQLLDGDIKASNLEKIANFFMILIDYLFDREPGKDSINITVNMNHIQGSFNKSLVSENKSLEALIEEKDKRIAILEEMVDILKKQK